MNPRYPQVALRALHRCEYCHAPESVFNFPFSETYTKSTHGGLRFGSCFSEGCPEAGSYILSTGVSGAHSRPPSRGTRGRFTLDTSEQLLQIRSRIGIPVHHQAADVTGKDALTQG